MRYRIAYDEPGRLRVRFGPDAFTQEQGYGIAALLLGRPGVREAVTCALNGSVLVCYEGEGRAEALAVLRGLRRDALPVGTAADDDQLRQVDSQFLGRLLSMAARHFLKKWFLPFPVRCAVTLWNAAGYWREGLRSLGGGRLDVAVLDAASIAGAIARWLEGQSEADRRLFLGRYFYGAAVGDLARSASVTLNLICTVLFLPLIYGAPFRFL